MLFTGLNFFPPSSLNFCRETYVKNQIAAWCGLTPKVSQSADMLVTGGITKQGSKHIRRMLVQVAHSISRTRNSRLKSFFLRIKAKKGTKKAAVALARKVLCILRSAVIGA